VSEGTDSYVLFELAGSLYAIPTQSVRHIDMVEEITQVPNANPVIDGVVLSRGQVIPALNLRARFGFPRAPHSMRSRIIFAVIHDRTVGLIVDTAREFRKFDAAKIRPMEETLTGIKGKYLKAVTKLADRLVLIVDLEGILTLDDVELPAQTPPEIAAAS
jgi:chemotaxis signal transduction protein